MSKKELKRKNIRAPLFSQVILAMNGEIYIDRSLNISLYGILVEKIKNYSAGDKLAFSLALPVLKNFKEMDTQKLLHLHKNDLQKNILRFYGIISENYLDDEIKNKYVIRFLSKDKATLNQIENYINHFKENVDYLVSLFDGLGLYKNNVVLLKKVSELLGYDKDKNISQLRATILHHSQSLFPL
jgi:hypothetical protein